MSHTDKDPAQQPSRWAARGSAPVVALVVAVVVGLAGIAIGAWLLIRRQQDKRGRRLAWIAIAIGIAQTIVVVVLVSVFALGRPSGSPPPASQTNPTSSRSYPTTPPPSGPVPSSTASETPLEPSATTLQEFVPDQVVGHQWTSTGDDTRALDAGAQAAEEGTFSAPSQKIEAQIAQWDNSDEASADAQNRAKQDFPGVSSMVDGQIMKGAGHYWYYERDGVGTVYWYTGSFSAQFSGDPYAVQEFFLQFPKT